MNLLSPANPDHTMNQRLLPKGDLDIESILLPVTVDVDG